MIAEFQRSLGSVVNWRGPVSRKGWGWGAVGRPWLRSPIWHQKIGGERQPPCGRSVGGTGKGVVPAFVFPGGVLMLPGLRVSAPGSREAGAQCALPDSEGETEKGRERSGLPPQGKPSREQGQRGRGRLAWRRGSRPCPSRPPWGAFLETWGPVLSAALRLWLSKSRGKVGFPGRAKPLLFFPTLLFRVTAECWGEGGAGDTKLLYT